MKKIINGKKYDTETAAQLGSWSNELYGDLYSCSETLYRKSTGELFLHGEGGARSIYASSTWDGTAWGESIVPLSDEDARAWAEEKLGAEEYEKIFGEVAE